MSTKILKALKRAITAGKQAYRREVFVQENKASLKRTRAVRALFRRHPGVKSILEKTVFKEALRDASKRSKGPRLKGIE